MDDNTRVVDTLVELVPFPRDSGPVLNAPENTSSLAIAPLTKSAKKKLAKAERYAASKLERRAREKEMKKEKKRIKAEKRAAGELDDDDEEERRRKKKPKIRFGGKVVVDLGFDDMMNEKEIKSLCSQLAYTYSVNRNASYPFDIVCTSLNGRTLARLESLSNASYKRWAKTEWWEEGYERLWDEQQFVQGDNIQQDRSGSNENEQEILLDGGNRGENAVRLTEQKAVQQTVVYLTADAEEELTELRTDEVYIIGGICDHNRYKNLCLNKAKESGIRAARLPIGRYIASLPTRKVLTVNQVFEILLRWVETKNWEEAFYAIIPKRKFQGGNGKGKDEVEDLAGAGEAEVEAEPCWEGDVNVEDDAVTENDEQLPGDPDQLGEVLVE